MIMAPPFDLIFEKSSRSTMDSPDPYISHDSFAEDLQAEPNARSIVIVGASRIDNSLLEILRTFLLPKKSTAKNSDELLEGDNPLGTFSSRIKMCYRLGLVDETLYSVLDEIRRVRNLCAHEVAFDGTKSPARDHLGLLKSQLCERRSYKLTQKRYFGTDALSAMNEWQCLILTVCTLLEATRQTVDQVAVNQKSLKITAR
jgi:DNA-binding MltR family transcriptional regulator